MHLSFLTLHNLRTNRRETRKILKSLHSTRSLLLFDYCNLKATGLVYQLEEEVEENSVDMKFEVKDVKGIFLNSLPPWIRTITFRTSYKRKDFRSFLTHFYRGGVLSEYEYFNEITFGDLDSVNENDLGWFKYVLEVKCKERTS